MVLPMDTSILSLIRTRYGTFSASQKQVADFVLKQPDRVMISSMFDLATACNVSEPTIMRFLRKLGYESYQMFRVGIAQELGSGSNQNLYSEEIQTDDTADVIIRKVMAVTAQSLSDSVQIIDPAVVTRAVDHILAANRVFIIGVGSSCAQALDLSHKLQRLGIFATHCNDAHMINIMASNLTGADMVFAFSHSGESREILDGIQFARQNGAHIVSVTSYPHSSIVSISDDVIFSSSHEMKYRSDAMTSRIIQMAIIDTIYVCIAMRLGPVAEQCVNRTRSAVTKNKT